MSIIQIGSDGSNMAIPMLAKVMAPVRVAKGKKIINVNY